MDDAIDERLDAVERAVTDGEAADGLPDAARTDARLDDLETTVDGLEDRLADLEATVEAVRGFAGGIQAVDEAVERRADAAVARVERLESELRELERDVDDPVATDPRDGGGAVRDGPTARGESSGSDGAARPFDERRDARSDGSVSTDAAPGTTSAAPPSASRSTDTDLAQAAVAVADREMERAAADDRNDAEDGADASLADRLRRLL